MCGKVEAKAQTATLETNLQAPRCGEGVSESLISPPQTELNPLDVREGVRESLASNPPKLHLNPIEVWEGVSEKLHLSTPRLSFYPLEMWEAISETSTVLPPGLMFYPLPTQLLVGT